MEPWLRTHLGTISPVKTTTEAVHQALQSNTAPI